MNEIILLCSYIIQIIVYCVASIFALRFIIYIKLHPLKSDGDYWEEFFEENRRKSSEQQAEDIKIMMEGTLDMANIGEAAR